MTLVISFRGVLVVRDENRGVHGESGRGGGGRWERGIWDGRWVRWAGWVEGVDIDFMLGWPCTLRTCLLHPLLLGSLYLAALNSSW